MTTEQAEYENDHRAITTEQAKNESDHQAITTEQAENESDHQAITTEQAENESDHQAITTEQAENGSDHQAITTEQAANGSDHQPITTEQAANGSDHQPRRHITAPTKNHLLVRKTIIIIILILFYCIYFQCQRKIRTLMSELASVTECRILGMYLGVAVFVLDKVERENQRIENQKMEMLCQWIKSTPQAAWEDVISALRMMNENRVANYIEGKYCGGGQDDLNAISGNNMKFTVLMI